MKVALIGKVVERNKRKGKDGTEKYSIVIEEPGQYPNTFQFLVKNPAIIGSSTGFAAVGKQVQITGYLNGKLEVMQRKDGTGSWKNYRMWCNLDTIQAYGQEEPQQVQSEQSPEDYEDVPF